MQVYANSASYTPDDRADSYRMVGDILVHVAERCSVTVDDTTRTRWREAMGLLREFDTFADEHCPSTHVALSELGSFTMFAARYPSLARDALGAPTHDQMMGYARTILELGQLIATETDVDRYLELRKVEAYYTVQVLGAAATDSVKHQTGFTECMWRMTGFGIGANLADSLIDARYDYAQGKARLKPSAAFYAHATADVARHSRPHLHTVLDIQGVTLRAKMIKQRVANRLKHGVTPYSNLQLLTTLWRRRPRGNSPT